MFEGGYVKIPRSLLSWEWYTDINVCKLFLHLLLTVNFEDCQWRGIVVKRGSRVTSTAKLADETGLTEKQVRTALNKLIRAGYAAKKVTNKYSVISLENYNEYQEEGKQLGSQRAGKGQAEGSQRAGRGQQYKKDKKDKKEKKEKNIYMTDLNDPAPAPAKNTPAAETMAEMVRTGVPLSEIARIIREEREEGEHEENTV